MLIGGGLGLLWGAFISWAWRLLCDQGDWGEGGLPDENNLISKAPRWERRVEGISSWCSLTQALEKKKSTVFVHECVCATLRIYVAKRQDTAFEREKAKLCVPNGHNYQHQNPAHICWDHTFCFPII